MECKNAIVSRFSRLVFSVPFILKSSLLFFIIHFWIVVEFLKDLQVFNRIVVRLIDSFEFGMWTKLDDQVSQHNDNFSFDPTEKLTGWRLISLQMAALYIKRFHNSRRNMKGLFCEVIYLIYLWLSNRAGFDHDFFLKCDPDPDLDPDLAPFLWSRSRSCFAIPASHEDIYKILCMKCSSFNLLKLESI